MKSRKKSAHKKAKPRPARARRKQASVAGQPQVQRISGIKVPGLMQLVSVYLNVSDVDAALDFYVKAFGFKKKFAMPGPDGKSFHGEVMHGNCSVMIGRPTPESGHKTPADLGGTPTTVYVYVKDVDALAERARAAGAQIVRGPADEYWGDRICGITDPYGHQWYFATLKRIVPPSEMKPPA
jgi:PhnB protein